MQKMQPCARCEQELPESFFADDDAMFCKRCQQEVNELLKKKYSIIEAAHVRAQLRKASRQFKRQYKNMQGAAAPNHVVSGD